MRVAIAGAGSVGRSIARELLDNGHEVLLIDREPAAIKTQSVPKAEWLLADACEVASLEEAGLQRLSGRHRRDRRRQGQPGRVAARQDGVRRAAHRRAGQQPEERVDVRRGVGRRRRGLDAAPDDRPRRGGGQRRRPGAHLHVPAGQHRPGRADAAGRLTDVGQAGSATSPGRTDTALVAIIREGRPIAPSADDPLEAGDELLFVATPTWVPSSRSCSLRTEHGRLAGARRSRSSRLASSSARLGSGVDGTAAACGHGRAAGPSATSAATCSGQPRASLVAPSQPTCRPRGRAGSCTATRIAHGSDQQPGEPAAEPHDAPGRCARP